MKKLNKFFAILVALAMMATLCVSMSFASPADLDEDANEVAASTAYLNKYLEIDEGVTIPDATFTFNFEKAKLTDAENETMNSTTVKLSEVPLPEETVQIKARDMHASRSTVDNGALVGNVKVFGTDAEVAAGDAIFTEAQFPHYGEYIYKVTETITPENPAIGNFETNTQEYVLHIYYTADGFSVTVQGEEDNPNYDPEDDDSEPTKPVKKDASVDDPSEPENTPTDPSDDKTEDQISQTDVEGFSFVNGYTLKDEYQPGENGAFNVSKTTTGAYGDKTQGFPIKVKVTFPTNYNGDKALNMYKGTADQGALDEAGEITVTLKDGENAYFKNLPEGATVQVVEDLTTAPGNAITNAAYYIQTSESVTGGAAAVAGAVTDAEGAAYTKTKTKDDADLTKLTAADVIYHDTVAPAEKDNHVAVTNNNVYDPGATGILLNNLPYIALALVAIGGLCAYVIVRRKADDEA